MRGARKVAAPSKKSVARSATPSRKRSSAKSVPKRSNQRTRPESKVARNQVSLANPVTEAVAVTAEVTAGAIEATGKVAGAAADMAQTAAETLAAVATGATPDKDPEKAGEEMGEVVPRRGCASCVINPARDKRSWADRRGKSGPVLPVPTIKFGSHGAEVEAQRCVVSKVGRPSARNTSCTGSLRSPDLSIF